MKTGRLPGRILNWFGAAAIVGALVLGAIATRAAAEEAPVKAKKKYTIAVIPKGTTHDFWKMIHAGAVKGARETGCEIIWKGPQREDDREQQIQVIEDFITRKVDGIVLAPLDNKALVGPVRQAKRAGVPVVIIDSGLQGKDYESFVATDNKKGGQLGAKRLAEVLGDKGKVILLRYQQGSASTTEREDGFLEEMKAHPGIQIISSNQYAGATAELAYQQAQNLLTRFADVDGIFCVNESSTFGMLRALGEANRAGKVKFVGFDSNDKLVDALRKGEIHGLVQQDPVRMAELGVKTMVRKLNGEKIEAFIDTGVRVLTPDNLNDPEIDRLIHPPLAEYLN